MKQVRWLTFVGLYIYKKNMFITPICLITIFLNNERMSLHDSYDILSRGNWRLLGICSDVTRVLEVRCWYGYCFLDDLVCSVCLMITFNNISVISGRSVLLVGNRSTSWKWQTSHFPYVSDKHYDIRLFWEHLITVRNQTYNISGDNHRFYRYLVDLNSTTQFNFLYYIWGQLLNYEYYYEQSCFNLFDSRFAWALLNWSNLVYLFGISVVFVALASNNFIHTIN